MAIVKKALAVLWIRQDWCKGCGICVAFCPRGALSQNEQGKVAVDPEECSLCAACTIFCPDFAIALK